MLRRTMESVHDHVVARLRECRSKWDAVAKSTGVSRRTIEKIVSGEIQDPRLKKFEKLALHFGIRWTAPKDR